MIGGEKELDLYGDEHMSHRCRRNHIFSFSKLPGPSLIYWSSCALRPCEAGFYIQPIHLGRDSSDRISTDLSREHAAPVTSCTHSRRPAPHRPAPGTTAAPASATWTTKTSQHLLWCGGCSSFPGSQTSSPVLRLALRRGPLSVRRDVRVTGSWNEDGRSGSLGGRRCKVSKCVWTPDRVLAASRSPPMHQTVPSQTESHKRGGEGPLSSLFPIKEPHGACAEPRPAPLTGEPRRATNAINCFPWIREGRECTGWTIQETPSSHLNRDHFMSDESDLILALHICHVIIQESNVLVVI